MLVRWNDPFRDLQRVQDQMNRLLDTAFTATGRPAGQESATSLWAPPVDIVESPEKLTFRVEVPGFRHEDLRLSVEGGTLSLEGERKFEEETKEKSYHRVERSYGRFFRSFALPANIDPTLVKANLSDGVLTIDLPKREEARPKQIPIGSDGPKRIESKDKAA